MLVRGIALLLCLSAPLLTHCERPTSEAAQTQSTSTPGERNRGNAVLAQLMDGPDDELLVDTVSDAIVLLEKQGQTRLLKPAHRDFIRVYHLGGVYSNGGYRYFLETTNDLVETRAALEDMGVKYAAAGMQRVFALFPGGRPHSDWDARIAFLGKLSKTQLAVLESARGIVSETATSYLADHIRKHRSTFLELPPTPRSRLPISSPFPGADASPRQIANWATPRQVEIKVLPDGGSPEDSFEELEKLGKRRLRVSLSMYRRDNTAILEQLRRWRHAASIAAVSIWMTPQSLPELAVLQKFTGLREVSVTCEGLRATEAAKLAGIATLESLTFASHGHSDRDLAPLDGHPRLRSLSLTYVEITGTLGKTLASLPSLTELYIGYAKGTVPVFDASKFKALGFDECRLADPSLAFLRDAPLQELSLDDTSVTAKAWTAIGSLRSLRELLIWQTGIPGKGIEVLARHPRLAELHLSGVTLGTAEAKALATIPSIKLLYASSPYPPAAAAALLRKAFPKAQLSVDDN